MSLQESTNKGKKRKDVCPGGWQVIGKKCVHATMQIMIHTQGVEHCEAYGTELVSWKDKGQYLSLKYYLQELEVIHGFARI